MIVYFRVGASSNISLVLAPTDARERMEASTSLNIVAVRVLRLAALCSITRNITVSNVHLNSALGALDTLLLIFGWL